MVHVSRMTTPPRSPAAPRSPPQRLSRRRGKRPARAPRGAERNARGGRATPTSRRPRETSDASSSGYEFRSHPSARIVISFYQILWHSIHIIFNKVPNFEHLFYASFATRLWPNDHGQKWAVSVEARDLSWSDKIASSYLVSILLKRPGELLACWNSNIYINIYYGDSGTVPLGLRDFFVYLKWQITYIICICNCLNTLFACWVSIYSHLTKNGSVKGRRTKTPVKLLTTFINI